MFTSTRFLVAFATSVLLSLTALAQPMLKGPAPRSVAASRQQTAPARGSSLALASARTAEPTSTEAPETVVLTGVVLRANGQPLPGAGVYLAGAAKQVVVTDEHGAFSLPIPNGRPVAVQAEYFGLGSTRVNLSAPLAQPLRITIGN